MAVSYCKLFNLLNSKHILLQSLCKKFKISSNVEKNIRKNKYVSLEALDSICAALDCKIEDIIEFVPDNVEPKIDV